MTIKKSTDTVIVIRYLDDDDDYVYLRDAWQDHSNEDEWRTSCAYTLEEAMDITRFSEKERQDLFMSFHAYYEDCDAQMVKITTTVECEDLTDVDEGEYREMRQRVALKKLTEGDIRALGITNIATYIKTKYHNA